MKACKKLRVWERRWALDDRRSRGKDYYALKRTPLRGVARQNRANARWIADAVRRGLYSPTAVGRLF